ERIRSVVYLDAFLPRDGESLHDIMPELAARMEEVAREKGDGWRVPREPALPRRTPQPIRPFRDAVRLSNSAAADIPRVYVLFEGNTFPHAPVMARMAERARDSGYRVITRPWDHIAPETEPEALADLLHQLASTASPDAACPVRLLASPAARADLPGSVLPRLTYPAWSSQNEREH